MDYIIDGTQTEYVRTPFADNSLYVLPDTVDTEIVVFLSDVLPTSYEIGVQYGDVKNQVIPLSSLVLAYRYRRTTYRSILFTSQYYCD